jgi:hypothetical protein
MILPILISVSAAPVSYVFWASAPVLAAANTRMVADNIFSRSRNTGMIDLLGRLHQFVSIILDVHFLVANDFANATAIALDHAGGDDECGLTTSELAGPIRQSEFPDWLVTAERPA